MSKHRKENFSNIPNEIEQVSEKEQAYQELFQGLPDAIFILSGSIVKKKKTDRYKSTAYSDTDDHGLLGGKARVIAAAEIGNHFQSSKLVTNSKTFKNGEPADAEVIAGELQRYGIPTERIIKQEKSDDTLEEIIELVKLAKEHDWKHIGVISSEFHIPRAQALYEHLHNFVKDDAEAHEALDFCKKNNTQVVFVTAENILPHRDKRYAALIDEVRQTEDYKRRVDSEQGGVEKILNDKYIP